jgi:hypothetical protein
MFVSLLSLCCIIYRCLTFGFSEVEIHLVWANVLLLSYCMYEVVC